LLLISVQFLIIKGTSEFIIVMQLSASNPSIVTFSMK